MIAMPLPCDEPLLATPETPMTLLSIVPLKLPVPAPFETLMALPTALRIVLPWMLYVRVGFPLPPLLTKMSPAPAMAAIDWVKLLVVKTKSPLGVLLPLSRNCTKCEREPVNVEPVTVTFTTAVPEAIRLRAELPKLALFAPMVQ